MSKAITRRNFVAAAGATLGAAASGALARKAKDKLNILVVICDQERAWKTLPAALELPGRRQIAARGVHFTNYQVNGIACGPSRSVIYTGQHIMKTRVYDNGGPPPRAPLDPRLTPTIGNLLQQEGYYTAYKGKWHLSPVNRPEIADYTDLLKPFGFNEWQKPQDSAGGPGEGTKRDPEVTTDAVEWLMQRAPRITKDRPWFLAVNLLNPHDIMYFDATGRQNQSRLLGDGAMITAPVGAPYDQDLGFGLPVSFPDTLGNKPPAHAAFYEYNNLLFGQIPVTDLTAWRRYQNYYFNCLRDVDTQLIRIFAALESSGQAGRTVVLLTGDHGEMGGAHGMRAKGPMIYAENVDVPLVVIHPDVRGGSTSNAVVGALDLVPTMLSFAGVDALEAAQRYPFLKGYDISPLVSTPSASGPRDQSGNLVVFTAALGTHPMATWRRARLRPGEARFPADHIDMSTRSFLRGFYDRRYRFGRYFSPNNHHVPTTWEELLANNDLELYDEIADPHSLDNLANDPATHKDTILSLNSRLNVLIGREVGIDDGSHMPGDPRQWRRA